LAAAELWSEVAAARRGKWRFWGLSLSMSSRLCTAEAVALQDVVGEGVPEHDGADLFDAARLIAAGPSCASGHGCTRKSNGACTGPCPLRSPFARARPVPPGRRRAAV